MPVAASEAHPYLSAILVHTRGQVAERKLQRDAAAVERAAAEHTPRGFARALRERASRGETVVIAELKKASPSRGLIREPFDAAELAAELEQAGAAALSVLTDERFFQGSLQNLRAASEQVSLPCLRKDFMVDPLQVVEARAHRADAILLIVAALDDKQLRELRDEARRCGLDVLCEVHDRAELERALPLECECVGVNSRDLRTFEVSLERAAELGAMLPAGTVRVAESGLHTRADLLQMQAAGFDAFLIGESLMREAQPGAALRRFLGREE